MEASSQDAKVDEMKPKAEPSGEAKVDAKAEEEVKVEEGIKEMKVEGAERSEEPPKKLNFSDLVSLEVMGVFRARKEPHLYLATNKGMILFKAVDICKIKPGVDFGRLDLEVVKSLPPDLWRVGSVDAKPTITKLTSTLYLESNMLQYNGLHEGSYWFVSDECKFWKVLEINFAPFHIQFFYNRSSKGPFASTDWIFADERVGSTPIGQIILDADTFTPIAEIPNLVISSWMDTFKALFFSKNYMILPLNVSFPTVRTILEDGGKRKALALDQGIKFEKFPDLPSWITVREFDDLETPQ